MADLKPQGPPGGPQIRKVGFLGRVSRYVDAIMADLEPQGAPGDPQIPKVGFLGRVSRYVDAIMADLGSQGALLGGALKGMLHWYTCIQQD